MSVVIETTLGDLTVDLYLKERPRSCVNFLKLCKMKYYNFNLFHTISRGFIAQTGDPTGSRKGGNSVYGTVEGPAKRYFEGEKNPRIKHTHLGLVSFVGDGDGMIGSQFFVTLGNDLTYLDDKHCVFGEIVEGLDVIELINETICDDDNRPYKDVRITHTVVLDDPFPDVKGMRVPSRSPSPSAERLKGGRIGADEDIDDTEGKTAAEISEMLAEREAKARATILEMVGDLPDAEMAPPENVLFVCKLNPVTTDDDLEIIFSRFGKIKSCEVIRDRKTGDSLQYSFVEFEDKKSCEDAYFKMDNVLIDDRRIHVDFSQSVSKIKWHGKGRGVTTYDDKGRKAKDFKNDIGQGKYKKADFSGKKDTGNERNDGRSKSPRHKDSDKREFNRNNDRRRGNERLSDSRRNDAHHYRDDRMYESSRREYNRRNDMDNRKRYEFDRKDQRRFDGERRDYSTRYESRRGHEENRSYSQNDRDKKKSRSKKESDEKESRKKKKCKDSSTSSSEDETIRKKSKGNKSKKKRRHSSSSD